MKTNATWLEESLKNPKVKEAFAREWLVESFLTAMEREMAAQEVSRQELAKRMGCKLPNVSRAFRGITNLTTQTMANMALALNLSVQTKLEEFPGLQLDEIEFSMSSGSTITTTTATSGLSSANAADNSGPSLVAA